MMLGFWEGLSRICEHYGAPTSDTLITPTIDFSPHLASPVGEGQIPLLLDYQGVINIQE